MITCGIVSDLYIIQAHIPDVCFIVHRPCEPANNHFGTDSTEPPIHVHMPPAPHPPPPACCGNAGGAWKESRVLPRPCFDILGDVTLRLILRKQKEALQVRLRKGTRLAGTTQLPVGPFWGCD